MKLLVKFNLIFFAVVALGIAISGFIARDILLANARERLRLAEARYRAGVGSIIEMGDAQVAMVTASSQSVQAEYSLATARSQLQRALGRLE